MYVYIYAYAYGYVYVYVYIYAHIYAYAYGYAYVYIYIKWPFLIENHFSGAIFHQFCIFNGPPKVKKVKKVKKKVAIKQADDDISCAQRGQTPLPAAP